MRRTFSKKLVLLSGGIDSAVAGLFASQNACDLVFLTFSYQQLNDKELVFSKRLARYFSGKVKKTKHIVYPLDFSVVASSQRSALLSKRQKKGGQDYQFYVPGRNLIFLSHASAIAEAFDINEIYVGSNFQDNPGLSRFGYPDSGRVFLKLAQKVINKGLKYNNQIKIIAPLINMNKYEAIRYGWDRKFDFGLTWSCYRNERVSCGECPACLTRILNFHWAGVDDPLPYRFPFGKMVEKAFEQYVS